MDREEYASWLHDMATVEKQLSGIESAMRAFLTELGCPTDPVQIYAALKGEQTAPWPKKDAERMKHRVRVAMFALLHVGIARGCLGPSRASATRAADASMMAAALATQALAIRASRMRATTAGKTTKTKRQQTAARQHAALRRKAKKLSPKLSTSAKAEILARKSTLSVSRIRHILSTAT